jgi:hypothetical protein
MTTLSRRRWAASAKGPVKEPARQQRRSEVLGRTPLISETGYPRDESKISLSCAECELQYQNTAILSINSAPWGSASPGIAGRMVRGRDGITIN